MNITLLRAKYVPFGGYMHSLRRFAAPALITFLVACTAPHVPEQYKETATLPPIYPDYIGVTVPVNIAPLTMELLSRADDAVIRYSTGRVAGNASEWEV